MAFYIKNFVSKLRRTDPITFVNGDEKKDVFVNLELLSQYTSFFQEKNSLFVDNIYEIPFDIGIAIDALEHVHTLFTTLSQNTMIFILLKAYDYFCIDVSEIYEHISTNLNYSDTLLLQWTREAVSNGTDTSLDIINKFYNSKFVTINFCFFSYDKDVILFLLKRKWMLHYPADIDVFIKKSCILETYLFQTIMNYIAKEKDYDCEKDFLELWKHINPIFLSKDTLANFSNQPLSSVVCEQVSFTLNQKYRLFSCYPIVKTSRFFIKEQHLKLEDLSVSLKVQVMDIKQKWYNSKIIDIDYSTRRITVNFDLFSSKYDESISFDQMHRFLPYGTLEKDHICPCQKCICEINDKNFSIL